MEFRSNRLMVGPPAARVFKCVLAGPVGSGKSAFVRRLRTGGFAEEYSPSTSAAIYRFAVRLASARAAPLVDVRVDVWDCGGWPEFAHVREDQFRGADCAIVMFDTMNADSYRVATDWADAVRRVAGRVPIVTVGNKCDGLTGEWVRAHERKMTIVPICVKTGVNVKAPLLALVRELLKDPTLRLSGPLGGGV